MDVTLQLFVTRDELEGIVAAHLKARSTEVAVVSSGVGSAPRSFDVWRREPDVDSTIRFFQKGGSSDPADAHSYRLIWTAGTSDTLWMTHLGARSADESTLAGARALKRSFTRTARTGVLAHSLRDPAHTVEYRTIWSTSGAREAFAAGAAWRQPGSIIVFSPPSHP